MGGLEQSKASEWTQKRNLGGGKKKGGTRNNQEVGIMGV